MPASLFSAITLSPSVPPRLLLAGRRRRRHHARASGDIYAQQKAFLATSDTRHIFTPAFYGRLPAIRPASPGMAAIFSAPAGAARSRRHHRRREGRRQCNIFSPLIATIFSVLYRKILIEYQLVYRGVDSAYRLFLRRLDLWEFGQAPPVYISRELYENFSAKSILAIWFRYRRPLGHLLFGRMMY